MEYAKKINEIGKQLNKRVKIHIKIDTGMSRLGFLAEEAIKPIEEINKLKNIYSVEENAKRNDTINYEVLCMINRRVTRVYKDNNKSYSINYLLI